MRSRSIAERKDKMAPMISAFLFYNAEASEEGHKDYIAQKVRIRQMLKDPLNREVLSEILLDLRKDLTGDVQLQLFELYQDLGLHMDAFKKLKSWRWEVVSQGIEALTEMRVTLAYTFIKSFVNDKRGVIRKQAQLATVTLKPEGISYFLDTARYRISEWQQLNLLDILRHKKDFIPPSFKSWLISKNTDVVLFALRLIKYYNQSDANEELIQLARHKSNRVKMEVIECIDKFHIYEALDTLKAVFPKCNSEVKIAILTTIANMGSEADLEFLDKISRKDSSFLVRTKAQGSMNAVSPGTVSPTVDLEEIVINPDEEFVADDLNDEIAEEIAQEEEGREDYSYDELEAILEDEDEEIFDTCFLEELKEILAEAHADANDENEEVLPLDFLPLVTQDGEANPTPYISEIPFWDMEVVAESAFDQTDYEGKGPESDHTDVPAELEEVIDWDNEMASFEEMLSTGEIWSDESSLPVENEDGAVYKDESPEEIEDEEALIEDVNCPEKECQSPGESVFAKLFIKSDRAGKLLLLDEIRRIGEEKEFHFLQNLSRDEDPQILRSARLVTQELARKFKNTMSGEEQALQAIEGLEGEDNSTILFEIDSFDEASPVPGNGQFHEKDSSPLRRISAIWNLLIRKQ